MRLFKMLLIYFSLSHLLQAQIVNVSKESEQRIFVAMAFEPELVTMIGYAYIKNNRALGTSFEVPILIAGSGDWKLNVFGTVKSSFGTRWRNILTGSIYLANDKSRMGVMRGVGLEIRSSPLYEGRNWRKGFDLGWQSTLLAHIKHSSQSKATFHERYPDAEDNQQPIDGWYGLTANRFRLGVLGARHLGDKLNLQIATGALVGIQRQGLLMQFSHAQVPFYLEAALSYQLLENP